MALMTDRGRRMVAAWLFLCAALVFAIVLVGGITRLTRSGLSIVEWQPLIGALPPLSELEWQALFAKYRETPEFRLVNHAMTLEGFKGIFWWEYIHRLLARGIGLVFLLPLLFFQFANKLDRPLALKLWGIFALGALQGAMGWIMVQSGLVDDPKVNPVRLSAHLGIALAIFAAELWIAMQLVSQRMHGAASHGGRRSKKRGSGVEFADHRDYLWTRYQDRFVIFATIDFQGTGKSDDPATWDCQRPDFARRIADQLTAAKAMGLSGIKLFKQFGLVYRNSDGTLMRIDDPRWDPIWERCGELGLPVLMHTADPSAFFQPINEHNERWEELHRHP